MFGFEYGLVAISVGELDFYGAVVEQFGGAVAKDLISLVRAVPVEADR